MQPIAPSAEPRMRKIPNCIAPIAPSFWAMAYFIIDSRSSEMLEHGIGCWSRLCIASVPQRRRPTSTTSVLIWRYSGLALPSAAICESMIDWLFVALSHSSGSNIESSDRSPVSCFCRYSSGCDSSNSCWENCPLTTSTLWCSCCSAWPIPYYHYHSFYIHFTLLTDADFMLALVWSPWPHASHCFPRCLFQSLPHVGTLGRQSRCSGQYPWFCWRCLQPMLLYDFAFLSIQ